MLGDVRLVELRDVRQVDPARVQARTGDLLDARQRLALDRAERREVDDRHVRPRRTRAAAAGAPMPDSSCLTCALTSVSVTRPLAPVPATRARSTPSSRAKPPDRRARVRARETGFVDRPLGAGQASGRRRRQAPSPGSPVSPAQHARRRREPAPAPPPGAAHLRGRARRLQARPQPVRPPHPLRRPRSGRPARRARRAAVSTRGRRPRPCTARPSWPSRSRA